MARDTSFFTLVKEQVDLEDYLSKHLGVELVPEGAGRMAAVCPFHDEDTPSFKVMESDDGAWKRWWCFGACQEGGSVIDAAMKAENYETAHEAAQYLNELYGLGLEVDNEAYKRFARTVQETKDDIQRTREEMDDSASKAAKTAKAYLQNRGFIDETIDFFQLGVDTGRTKAGRLSIPLIDKANHPVSVANRALFDRFRCFACKEWVEAKEMIKLRHNYNKAKERGENPPSWKRCPHCDAPDKEAKVAWLVGQHPKYLFIRDFDKANFLYNEHGTRQILARDENLTGLFLVEGYADVWSGWQSGHKAICSYNGAELSDWQAKEAIELVERAEKPIILVPDFDETGQGRIDKNVRKLRALKEDIEIQIIHSLDRLTYDEDGERKRCKDLGDVLKHFGAEKVAELLDDNRWQASEWQIREVVEAKNPRTGEPFFSMSQQLQICAEILAAERSKVALDHLIPYLVEKWDRKEEIVRNWFYSNLSQENATSYQHLFKDIDQAREEAREFLQDDNVIPIGFDELDRCMPGDGARPGQLAMFLGKSGTGKTMLASQILAHMADQGVRSIIFTLEQAAKSLFPRLVCQALDISPLEAEELISRDDEEAEEILRPVRELYRNMLIIDNVPGEGSDENLRMTPARIQAIIQEANMTHFAGEPAAVVAIDHLGILEVDDDAPREIKGSENMRPGYIMQRLFSVCKTTSVFMMVLQQLPKEVEPGVAFGYDAGRGGSAQTDFCDYIFQIWRPEQRADLDDAERAQYSGQYKLSLGKNRYGPSKVAHLMFDKTSLRIMPVLEVTQPDHQNEEAVIDLPEGADDTITLKGSNADGATEAGARAIEEDSPNPVPQDTKALLDALGDDDVEELGDPGLRDWFTS
jgi:DNA primase